MARTVTLYTAAGCSLCDDALALLREVRGATGCALEIVDVAGDPALEAAYRESLPVVVVEGGPTFRLFLDREQLLAAVVA